VPAWLGALRKFFARDVVSMVQRDAVERKGLAELMFEPETLPLLEKNVSLVSTLIAARGLIPDRAKDIARQIIREVVDELRKRLETKVRTAVLGALKRDRHSPIQSARNIDWRGTIRANLKGWDRDRRRLIPERFHFWANQVKHHEWDIVLVVDQSGSMAESVVYSSVMAAIFASIDALRTRLIVFDTSVVDLTDKLNDPVEVLFAAQLGGGTDINRAVAYAEEHLIDRPEKTIFLLISDLEEGGDADALVARMRGLVEARVKVMCLLALNEGGQPAYSVEMAKRMANLGIPSFGCTPDRLVDIVEKVMKNQPIPTKDSV
jgi:Mg-chelatase subunit ChlD